jgi:hypothetical protein
MHFDYMLFEFHASFDSLIAIRALVCTIRAFSPMDTYLSDCGLVPTVLGRTSSLN